MIGAWSVGLGIVVAVWVAEGAGVIVSVGGLFVGVWFNGGKVGVDWMVVGLAGLQPAKMVRKKMILITLKKNARWIKRKGTSG
jgi:hypothetical protein